MKLLGQIVGLYIGKLDILTKSFHKARESDRYLAWWSHFKSQQVSYKVSLEIYPRGTPLPTCNIWLLFWTTNYTFWFWNWGSSSEATDEHEHLSLRIY